MPIHSGSYHAVQKTREFKKTEINKVLTNKTTDQGQTKTAFFIDFTSKNGTLRFCEDYRMLNVVAK